LAGITPLKSEVWPVHGEERLGIIIPDEIIDRMVKAKKPADEESSSAWNRFKNCGDQRVRASSHAIEWNIGFQKSLSEPNWFQTSGLEQQVRSDREIFMVEFIEGP